MSNRIYTLIQFILTVTTTAILVCSCGNDKVLPYQNFCEDSITFMKDRAHILSRKQIDYYIDSLRLSEKDSTANDYFCNTYYANRSPYIWISTEGIDERADSILEWFNDCDSLALPKQRFYTKKIKSALQDTRSHNIKEINKNKAYAIVEYYLTKSALRYCTALQFGLTNPYKLLNRLDLQDPDNPKSYFRTLYDIPTETFKKEYAEELVKDMTHYRISKIWESIQPNTPLYNDLIKIYNSRDLSASEKRLIAINIERARWRQTIASCNDMQVVVNIPSQQLKATKNNGDSVLTMKVCYGSIKHKTPLLVSKMKYLELNPYWIIPKSIIRKEIIPRHLGDSAYFARNKYRLIEKSTGNYLPPENASPELLLSTKYMLRQEQGDDNSLGRMIFRFDNKFSVYLHDTNSKEAFKRANRALSHGCVRIEKPFELASFLLIDEGESLVENVRLNYITPLDESPKTIKFPVIRTHPFKKDIDIQLCYYTILPKAEGFESYPDVYGYDEIIGSQIFR